MNLKDLFDYRPPEPVPTDPVKLALARSFA